MGGAGAQRILGLLPDHWWVKLGPGVSGCRALGFLGLVPVHWSVELGPGLSGGQGCVHGQLWIQGVLKHPVCWWVELCPHPTN